MGFPWNGWFTRFRRRNHEPTFLDTLDEVEHFKNIIINKKCSGCQQQTLQLKTFIRTPVGWDAEIFCLNCPFSGVVNSEGFDLHGIQGNKGKTRT